MFQIDVPHVLTAILVFLRTGAILFALPIFGDQPTPIQVRILLAVAISLCVFPLLPQTWRLEATPDVLELTSLVIREILVGVSVGYIARMAFDGILMAANMVGFQMGFGTSTLFVPDAGHQMDAFTAFHRIIVMLIFLMLNLHHIFIGGLVDTFRFIPPGGLMPNSAALSQLMLTVTSQIFVVAIQLAAPILVALMFTMAALGLVARAVPQLNVFTMSFPASFLVGLAVYIATLPFLPEWMNDHFMQTHNQLMIATKSLAP